MGGTDTHSRRWHAYQEVRVLTHRKHAPSAARALSSLLSRLSRPSPLCQIGQRCLVLFSFSARSAPALSRQVSARAAREARVSLRVPGLLTCSTYLAQGDGFKIFLATLCTYTIVSLS